MTNSQNLPDLSQRKAAIIAGISILVMAIAAGIAYGYILNSLVIAGDAAASLQNIQTSEMLYRMGIFCWLIILICDIIAAWGLYFFFKKLHNSLSLLTSWFRLIYASILAIAILCLVAVLLFLGNEEYLQVFEKPKTAVAILFLINTFFEIWSVGLFIFGLHLLGLAYLAIKYSKIPKLIAVLLFIAAFGYLITNTANLLDPNYSSYKATFEMILSIPMAIGELAFAIWLLIRGGKAAS